MGDQTVVVEPVVEIRQTIVDAVADLEKGGATLSGRVTLEPVGAVADVDRGLGTGEQVDTAGDGSHGQLRAAVAETRPAARCRPATASA